MIASAVEKRLKTDFKSLISEVNNNGFRVGIIGGFVRDTYLKKTESMYHDYDCEIRPSSKSENILDLFEVLYSKLKVNYQCDRLPYNIIRVKCDDFEAEFSLPRTESYTQEFHHSNFEAKFIADENYIEGFKRRDFTLNAVMVEFFNQEVKLIDPMHGLADLENGVLRACSENFNKDPVRFLRAIRFSLLLSRGEKTFKLSSEIKQSIKDLKLEHFTAHYLKYEMLKSSKPSRFLYTLLNLINFSCNKLEQSLLDDFDLLWQRNLKATYFRNALFFSIESREALLNQLGLGTKGIIASMPWKLESENIDIAWITKFEFIEKNSEDLVEFYFKHALIDLSLRDVELISMTKVKLDDVGTKERKLYKYSEKMRSYHEHKKN